MLKRSGLALLSSRLLFQSNEKQGIQKSTTETDLWHVNKPGCDMLSTRYRLSCPLALGAIETGTESSDGRFDPDGVRVDPPGLRKEREKLD
jgi:hypothetical protein